MRYIVVIVVLLLSMQAVHSQNKKNEQCVNKALELFDNLETDSAFKQICECKKDNYNNVKVALLYERIIWKLKSEYYHSESDLDLFDEFQLIVNTQLELFQNDTTLTKLLSNVIFDKSLRLISLEKENDGILLINNFIRKYPGQTNLIKSLILKSVIESVKQNNTLQAFNQLDLILLSEINTTTSENILTKLLLQKFEERDLLSVKILLELIQIKYPETYKRLDNIVCDKLLGLYKKYPDIKDVVSIQNTEKLFPTCDSLKIIEKKFLLEIIENGLKNKNYGLCGYAFRLAKLNFRNDKEILTLKKEWVIYDFNENYIKSNVTNEQLHWTGQLESCNAGEVSEFSHQMVQKRVNYFRRTASTDDSCTLNRELNTKAQQAALIMAANNELSHHPDINWKCFSNDGKIGARESNLSLGNHSTEAVTGQMEDEGIDNYQVGHRRWILYLELINIGHGSTDFSQALFVTDDFKKVDEYYMSNYISWPPEHYIMNELVFNRWSFSIDKADFSEAKISMFNNNKKVSLEIEKVEDGYGDNTIVWVPNIGDTDKSMPYIVKIDNVVLFDKSTKSYTYWVEIIK